VRDEGVRGTERARVYSEVRTGKLECPVIKADEVVCRRIKESEVLSDLSERWIKR
jgi:hypothetical protein